MKSTLLLKVTFLFVLIGTITISAIKAQTPQAFKYQTVVRDGNGQVLADQNVNFRISIQQSASFTDVYIETHDALTNAFGLAVINIGEGTPESGDFTMIDWGSDETHIQVEVDINGGTDYMVMGTSQLLAVPYAMHAKTAENVFSGDYNDLQNTPDMSNYDMDVTDDFDGDYNSLSNIPDMSGWDQNASDDFNGQYSSLTGAPTNVSSFTNDAGYLTSESDGDDSNEIQTLSLTGPNLTIQWGNTVDLSSLQDGYEANTDNQTLSLSGTDLSITGGNSIDLSSIDTDTDTQLSETEVDNYVANNGYLTSEEDGSTTNEIQTLVFNAALGRLFISDTDYNTEYVDLPDPSNQNELQTLSINGDELSISASAYTGLGGNTITLPLGAQSIDELSDGASDDYSIYFGLNAGANDDGYNYNIGIGPDAMAANANGMWNIGIGSSSLNANTSGAYNTAIGFETLKLNTTGGSNSAFGYGALTSLTSGYANTAVGSYSFGSLDSGSSNIGLGSSTFGSLTTGTSNIAIGRWSGSAMTEGYSNVYVGYEVDRQNETGSYNTMIGSQAGRTSAAIGTEHSKDGCVFIGFAAGYNETNSNKLYIENSSSSEPLIGGDFSTDEVDLNAKVNVRDFIHIDPQATPPTTGVKGDLYMDTDGYLYVHNGTAWAQIATL
jgi:hypothetical protein